MREFIKIEDYFKNMSLINKKPTELIVFNASTLLKKVNLLLNFMYDAKHLTDDDKIIVRSGWRTEEYNKKIGGAHKSHHITGNAIDLAGSKIILELEENENLLEVFKLYAESSLNTVIKKINPWTHIQNQAPKSKKRIFIG